jgi:hypothetical protein
MSQTATHDVYGPVHKGLRLGLSELLVRLGHTDYGDPRATAESLAHLRRQLAMNALHLHDEDTYLHPVIRRLDGDLAQPLDAAHAEHRRAFHHLESLAHAVETAGERERGRAAHRLYLEFGRFVAEDLEHMHQEETVTLPALQARLTDAELGDVEGRIIGSLSPDQLIGFLQHMLPAMTPQERLAFLKGVRAAAPGDVFGLIMVRAAQPRLSPSDWSRLQLSLAQAA